MKMHKVRKEAGLDLIKRKTEMYTKISIFKGISSSSINQTKNPILLTKISTMTKNNAKIVDKSYDLGKDDSKFLDQSENARKQKHKFKKVLVNSKLKP